MKSLGRALISLTILLFLPGCTLLPASKSIDVPFTSQAPAGDWSEPWLNACEETSIYMVSSFYAKDTIKRDQAIKNIKTIVIAKNKEFKVSADESLAKISEIIKLLNLPWQTEVVIDPSIDEIKKQLALNHPIIAPVYAPELNYSSGGANYHVMVITGYDDVTQEFIVNDPAISSGKATRFEYKLFMNAIHDLDPANFKAGKKAVLFTKPNANAKWF